MGHDKDSGVRGAPEIFQQGVALILPQSVQDGGIITMQVAGKPRSELPTIIPGCIALTQCMDGITAIAQGSAVFRIQADDFVGDARNRKSAYHGPDRLAYTTGPWVHIRYVVQYVHSALFFCSSNTSSICFSNAVVCLDDPFLTTSFSMFRI